MSRARDPQGFTELSSRCAASRCAASPAGRTMKAAALRRAATILAVKGGTLREITVGDCLELSLAIDSRSLRANKGMAFYQLLHEMGVFSPQAPSTIRAFGTQGQLSPAQLIDRYALACRPVRDVLLAYLTERQPMLDHTTLINLSSSLGGLFWRDLERHHPGICSFTLGPGGRRGLETAGADQDRRVVGPDGQTSEVRDRRAGGLHNRWPRSARSTSTSPVGDGRPAPVGAVGGPVPDPGRGPGPAEGDPGLQVADGSADPGTASRSCRCSRPWSTTRAPPQPPPWRPRSPPRPAGRSRPAAPRCAAPRPPASTPPRSGPSWYLPRWRMPSARRTATTSSWCG